MKSLPQRGSRADEKRLAEVRSNYPKMSLPTIKAALNDVLRLLDASQARLAQAERESASRLNALLAKDRALLALEKRASALAAALKELLFVATPHSGLDDARLSDYERIVRNAGEALARSTPDTPIQMRKLDFLCG